MRVLLVGIGSRFNHVNLAIRLLSSYANKYLTNEELEKCSVDYKQWTISTPLLDILDGIVQCKPDIVLFSVYIWNVSLMNQVILELPKILPNGILGCGGPEVSYQGEKILKKWPSIDFVISGEGERTILELCQIAAKIQDKNLFLDYLQEKNIKGLYLRIKKLSNDCIKDCEEDIFQYKWTGSRELIENLDEIPFCYMDEKGNLCEDISNEHSIIYYESARGCPFNCAYCLSSIDKTVRFASLERVCKDLQFFMDNDCRLVKFTDRTFNLKESHYLKIWEYIVNHHNGKTVFHFEIAAQYLSANALAFLQSVPENCMQFEIGIQSIHPETLNAVGRQGDANLLKKIIQQIPKKIHVHLDLIAGLPFESFELFGKSFDFTINLEPDMLQLGFLKILSGTSMESYALNHEDYKWLSVAPYQVLQSPNLSYEELHKLQQIESLVDWYYNSGILEYSMHYLIQQESSMFKFFFDLSQWFEKNHLFDVPHKVTDFFTFLHNYYKEQEKSEKFEVLKELLRFDFLRREKCGAFPEWYERNYDKKSHTEAVHKFTCVESTRETFACTDFDTFTINPLTFEKLEKNIPILFVYPSRKGKQIMLKTQSRFSTHKFGKWFFA